MKILLILALASLFARNKGGGGTTMVCGVTCPTCHLGCNRMTGHSGNHTDREHSW